MSILQKYWNQFHFEELALQAISKIISLILLIIFYIIIKKVLDYIFTHAIEKSIQFTKQNPMRQRTLTKLTHNIVNYALYFLLCYWVLSLFGIPVSSLLAGAGIAGVMIGLGAQGFLSDVVNGFFILLENQFDVDEVIEVGKISGKVTSIGIRTTVITGFDGTINFIPNRNISIVSNKSRGDMRSQIDLPIYADANLDKIISVVKQVNKEQTDHFPEIVEQPTIIGAVTNSNNQLVFRINIFVKNGIHHNIGPIFFHLYQEALLKEGIELQNIAPIISK